MKNMKKIEQNVKNKCALSLAIMPRNPIITMRMAIIMQNSSIHL